MDASGAARLAAVLKTRPDPPVVGLEQSQRTFRLGVVTAVSPMTVMFNNDPAAIVSELPVLNGYTGFVGDMVVVAVFDGGGMLVLGTVAPAAPGQLPWGMPWGYLAGTVDSTPRGSAVSNSPSAVVFPAQSFTAVANRNYKISWHASRVRNNDAGVSSLIVQFGGVGGVIQNAVVTTWAGGQDGELSAFMIGRSDTLFAPGGAIIQMLATASAAVGFDFQYANYGSYLLVEDMGPYPGLGPP